MEGKTYTVFKGQNITFAVVADPVAEDAPMAEVIAAIEAVVALPAWQARVLAWARLKRRFMGCWD